MAIVLFFLGILTGCFLTMIVKKISFMMDNTENTNENLPILEWKEHKKYMGFTTKNLIITFISGLLFLISFLQIGLNIILIVALALNCILIVVTFIDIEYQIIPDKTIIYALLIGIVCLFFNNISFINALGGMLLGGGLLLLLALVPGVLGGGDIKLMFVLGIFLGTKGAMVALLLAFVIASIISILLLALKIKKRKDYIPFGPFLSIGTFIAFLFF